MNTSPSGMLRSPQQGITGMPLIENSSSVPAATIRTRSAASHPLGQRLLGLFHRRVVGRADVEVKILERRRAHVGRLGERIGRIAQHDPLRLGDAHVGVHRLPPMLLVQVHLLVRHVGELAAVGRAADADVRLHLLHAGTFELRRPASCFPRSPSDRATAARRSISTTRAARPRARPPLRPAGKRASARANRTPR